VLQADQRQDWNDLARLDPYWAILSDSSSRFGRWDRAAFLRSGADAIEPVLRDGRRHGHPHRLEEALDFGCGTGRLTLALSRHFTRCLGLDVSDQMIDQARAVADGSGCRFAVNSGGDLSAFDSNAFDFVVSFLVLQHIPSARAKERFISEFIRVLRPGGLLAFQVPSWLPPYNRLQPRARLYALLRGLGVSRAQLYHRFRLHPIRMSFLPRERVLAIIDGAGGRLLEVRETRAGRAVSNDYLVTKGD
jgi:SAM-dependent methyltransferase